ncbi:MAG: hydrogenase maturation protease [Magnetococcales bacterium]|nr:hydrogenase maturation protease [Magnetococcales bacterium]
MQKTLIICVGNRFFSEDDTGPRVYDHLLGLSDRPEDIGVIDGGLAGLALLPLLEGRQRVVFVDRLEGLAPPGEPVILTGDRVAAMAEGYGHNAGIPFLLAMLPKVCSSPWPECLVVGMSGDADEPMIDQLARFSIEVARNGSNGF